MKIDITMPKLGESVTEGTIVKWLKKPGDFVKRDEPLLEISTDKVDSEIPSSDEGVLIEIVAQENETVEVGKVIARMETKAVATKKVSTSQERVKAPPVQKFAVLDTSSQASTRGSVNLIDVTMPKLGESVTEGTIVKWLKKPGDFVKRDEPLLEISTDKVDTEIPSPYEGVLKEILTQENATVEVGTVIARMESADVLATTATAEVEAPITQTTPKEAAVSGTRPGRGGRFYSPLVLTIARKEGIEMQELEQIPGTGLGGRVTKKDILKYIETRKAGIVSPTPAVEVPTVPVSPPSPGVEEVAEKWRGKRVEVIPMDNIRKKIAEHMRLSKATSPHVYGVAECDFTLVMGILQKHKAAFQKEEGFKLTVNPFILYAVTRALMDFPRVNSSLEGTNIIEKKYLNLGVAVATPKGLIVPVLKNAEEKSFRGLARAAYDLAIRARESRLTVDDVQDATFTITNYGVFGNIIGFPIINQPNVAIMGVGAIKKRVVVMESPAGDSIGIRSMGFLTLSYDHRIVDGELGDKFLQRVVHYLQNFTEEVI